MHTRNQSAPESPCPCAHDWDAMQEALRQYAALRAAATDLVRHWQGLGFPKNSSGTGMLIGRLETLLAEETNR